MSNVTLKKKSYISLTLSRVWNDSISLFLIGVFRIQSINNIMHFGAYNPIIQDPIIYRKLKDNLFLDNN